MTIKFNDEEQTLLFTTINSNGYIKFTEFTVDENNGGLQKPNRCSIFFKWRNQWGMEMAKLGFLKSSLNDSQFKGLLIINKFSSTNISFGSFNKFDQIDSQGFLLEDLNPLINKMLLWIL